MKQTSQAFTDILHVAQMAAMEAGDYALQQFTRVHLLHEKSASHDQVTEVDLRCERIITKILKKSFPSYAIFTEERTLPDVSGDYLWWVDPLDGTISYVFGLPYWGVAIALIYKGQPIVGVLYFPQTRDLYWAVKGGGAYRNYQRIAVSDIRSIGHGVVGIDYGYQTERKAGVLEVMTKIIDQVKYAVTYACTMAAMALVAEGKLTAYVHHMARRFDVAAGALLVTEAGGRVSDTKGKAVNWFATKPFHVLASNRKVHRQLVRFF